MKMARELASGAQKFTNNRISPSLEFAFPRSSRRSPESFYNKTGGEIKFLMAYRVANRKISFVENINLTSENPAM